MAPTLTLTPDIFNNPTQIKTKCITSNKTELLKPFLLPLPRYVLCDLFMLLSTDSFIFVCSGFQPFKSLSPHLLPILLLKPFFPHASPSSFLVIIACDPSLSWAACMSTGQGRAVAWNTGNLSVLHYPESDTLPAATASCQSHLREGWELMSPSTFQDWTLTGAVQCVSWVGGLCLTGFLTGLLSCSGAPSLWLSKPFHALLATRNMHSA